LSAQEIQESLQRRLQIFSPTGNALWLRLYDARPLLRAHQAGQAFPPGFWHGITSVWLQGLGNPFAAWHNPSPLDDAAPADLGITPQITLDWPLLQALANTEMEIRV
ncbi:MAG TPA: hypothetical protein VLF16_10005, partial [Pseudomonas sp.]|nr:hypothetical protein [Pseudomonas sp.]